MSGEGKYINPEYMDFFEKNLSNTDPEIFKTIKDELIRQQNHIELIASENIVSRAVLEAQGSVLTNKYAEGYPGKRYYNGCEHVDDAEKLAIERLKKLFNCKFANVQPHSGAQANGAVFLALLKPGDTIMGMSLNSGGHLTHGSKAAVSGKWFNSIAYDVDKAEVLALERVKKLFNCKFANVQPHSGAQANGAVYLALLNPGDPILGMSLNSGGHLTHGAKVALSGKWLNSFHYDVDEKSGLIDYAKVESLAQKHKPKLIIAGGSAYSRIIDFKKFKEIADSVNAYLMVDMAHFSGLVAGKGYPNPIEHADVVTSTTHKVLRGGRGGIILTNREDLIKKINSAVFPGYQGGPLMHVIAAKAVAFQEALQPSFKEYIKSVLANAKILSETLKTMVLKYFQEEPIHI